MKKLFLFTAFSFFISITYCQTLFTYGKHSVSENDFLRAYNKNKTPTIDKKQALKDYLDLYVKFKLKVQAAKDMQLDTLPSLQSDLQNLSRLRNWLKYTYLLCTVYHSAFELQNLFYR